VTKVLPAKYVYEFDLKGFFNNVRISTVMQLLEARGLPSPMLERLESILESVPDNLNFEDLPKIKSDYDKQLVSRKLAYGMADLRNPLKEMVANKSRIDVKSLLIDLALEPLNYAKAITRGDSYFLKPLDASLNTLRSIVDDKQNLLSKGLPQGAAPSTTLSLLVLSP